MSYVAFVGIVALAFLPPRMHPSRPAVSQLPAAKSAPAAAKPATAGDVAARAPTASSPVPPAAAAATPPTPDGATPAAVPPPDVWTPAQLAAGLRQCLQLLTPTGADIVIEEPMKHGQCGTPVPLELRSVGSPAEKVEFHPAPTMNCRLAAELSSWVEKVLQPAAQQVLGSRIKQIIGASSYSCRNIYNNPKLSLSEHATGNAVDIVGFVTADGRTITVSKGWGVTERDVAEAKKKASEKAAAKGPAKDAEKELEGEAPARPPTPSIEQIGKKAEAKEKGRLSKASFKQESPKVPAADAKTPAAASTKEMAFLKRVHSGSCTLFATVLGPEANEAHRDHFHLDMKVRQSSASVCH
jgi:hypothetical protein